MDIINFDDLKTAFFNDDAEISGTSDEFHALPEEVLEQLGLKTKNQKFFEEQMAKITEGKTVYARKSIYAPDTANYYWEPYRKNSFTCDEVERMYAEEQAKIEIALDEILNW